MAEDEWIELCRFSDGLQAKITRDFLEEHGVAVEVRGSAAEAGIGTYGVVPDVRLLVKAVDLDEAKLALEAFESAGEGESPYREQGERDEARNDEGPTTLGKKKPLFAVALAILVPIGGGSFYSGQTAAGILVLAALLASIALHAPTLLPLVLAFDALNGYFATKRLNEHRSWTVPRQLLVAGTALVVLALVGTDLVSDFRPVHVPCAKVLVSGDLQLVGDLGGEERRQESDTSCEVEIADYRLATRVLTTEAARESLRAVPYGAISRPAPGLGDEAVRIEHEARGGRYALCTVAVRKGRLVAELTSYCPGLHLEQLMHTVLLRVD